MRKTNNQPDWFETTVATMKSGMEEMRSKFHARCMCDVRDRFELIEQQLKANGYDAKIVAPFPRGTMSKADYRRAQAFYYEVRSFFAPLTVEPHRDIVVARHNVNEIIRNQAAQMVAQYFDGFVNKLALKIGKPVKQVTVTGSLWENSELRAMTVSGELQIWHTHCIFNRSTLGKIFNQWPTRQVS